MPDYDPLLLRMTQGILNTRPPPTRGAGLMDNPAILRVLNLNQPRLIPGYSPPSWYRTPKPETPIPKLEESIGNLRNTLPSRTIPLDKPFRVLDNKTGEIIGSYKSKQGADTFADKRHIADGGLPSTAIDKRRYLVIKPQKPIEED